MINRAPLDIETQSPDDVAAYWMARKMSGAMKAEERDSFEKWIAESDRNRQAFKALEGVLETVDAIDADLLAEEFERELHNEADAGRRRNFNFSAIAASLFVVAATAVGVMVSRIDAGADPAVYATAIGQSRIVDLDDGSRIDLNTGTQIEVAYSDKQRDVRLASGQAFFDVEPDRSRPFVIATNQAEITVTGTSFDVSTFDNISIVSVLTGAVNVTPEFGPSATLLAGDSVTVDADGKSGPVFRFNPDDVFAWRTGKLRFKERELGEVIPVLNRYLKTPLAIIDAETASRQVTGEFDITNEQAILKALTVSFALAPREESARIVLEPIAQ